MLRMLDGTFSLDAAPMWNVYLQAISLDKAFFGTRHRGYKTFFVPISAEHDIFSAN